MPSHPKGRGVLPVNAAATKKPHKQTPRPPAPRLRLIIRRLPPGLTEAEFWDCIGKEWLVGNGKVDWAAYKPGKISKDLAKPSRPARAYIKVKESAQLEALSTQLKSVVFQDAKNSSRDLCLIGPPTLEFAPYNKIPNGRARHDGRQGTIDQDPEFIDFLQSLTEPITKPATNGEDEGKQEKITITPLVQYIKEKKANKAKEKEAAASKTSKKADAKDVKSASPAKAEQPTVVKKSTASEAEKARVAKATQDVVKAINTLSKSAAAQQAKATAKQETPAKEPVTPTQPTAKRERQRGDINAAARIISRDLGLTPKENRTPRASRAVSTPAAPPTTATPTPPVPKGTLITAKPQTPTTIESQPKPPTGPRNLKSTAPQPSPLRPTPASPVPAAAKASTKSPIPPSSGAKSAFLKHANPSQGVTEELLRTTFSAYGTITKCEIDKKKGLGYLDFAEPEGLKKAMAASPVKIANGSVVVLENRSPYRKASQQAGQAKAASAAASTSTSVASSPKVAQAALASIAETTASTPTPKPAAVQTPATSTAEVTKSEVQATPPVVETTAASADASTTSAASPATLTAAVSTATNATATQTPPSAPRGAGPRSGGRGHYRGRGSQRGRGGYRGGNRAASSPAGNAIGAASTLAPASTPAPASSVGGGEGKS